MTSREVTDAVGEAESREERRARLQQIIEQPSAREVALREQMQMDAEDAARAQAQLLDEATDRLTKQIPRALGSLVTEYANDQRRVLDAARGTKNPDTRWSFIPALAALIKRYEDIALLLHEARTLAEVFGLQLPRLPDVLQSDHQPEVIEVVAAVSTAINALARQERRIAPAMVWAMTDAGLAPSGGRSYEELAGTPGRELIRRKLGR